MGLEGHDVLGGNVNTGAEAGDISAPAADATVMMASIVMGKIALVLALAMTGDELGKLIAMTFGGTVLL